MIAEIYLYFRNLLGSARALLHTPRKALTGEEVPPGKYLHIGLQKTLINLIRKSSSKEIPNTIQLDLSTDGGRLNKKYCVWPIFVRIFNIDKSKVGIVGIYVGQKQPNSSTQFFEALVQDVIKLKQNGGLMYESKRISVVVRCFIADALARAFMLNHKYCCAELPCLKCKVQGAYYYSKNKRKIKKTMVYLGVTHDLRTKEEYKDRNDINHYLPEPSPLDQILSDPLLDVPFEYMHLVLLGIMLKLMEAWLDGEYNRLERLSKTNKITAVERFSVINEYLPEEYARKSTNLEVYSSFKATEFRQIVLFSGILVFRGILPDYVYVNFLLFHISIRCLCFYVNSKMHLEFAEEGLITFVKQVEQIYTPAFMSYNVHGLLHLVDDAKRFGDLDSFSAFPFENAMGQLPGLIRKNDQYLEQISNRFSEFEFFLFDEGNNETIEPRALNQHFKENLSENCSQFEVLKYKGFTFRIKEPNNCVYFNNQIYVIVNIIKNGDSYFVKVRRFKRRKNFYEVGLSSIDVGVYLVSSLEVNAQIFSIDVIEKKCILIPYAKIYKRKEQVNSDSSDEEFEENANSYLAILM